MKKFSSFNGLTSYLNNIQLTEGIYDDASKKAFTVDMRKTLGRKAGPVDVSTFGIAGGRTSLWGVRAAKEMLGNMYELLKRGKPQSLLLLGGAGIGKSEVIRSFAEGVSQVETGKSMVNLFDIPDEEYEDAINNPKGKYLYVEIRGATLTPERASGLPDVEGMKRTKMVQFIRVDWVKLLTNPDFNGMLFLDEINRAPDKSILNTLLLLTLDRVTDGKRISKNCMIVAAANVSTGKGENFNENDMDSAFMGRFTAGVLYPDVNDWVEWAQDNGVDESIIEFILTDKEKNFYATGENMQLNDLPINPRSITLASKIVDVVKDNYISAIQKAKAAGVPEEKIDAQAIKPYLPNILDLPDDNSLVKSKSGPLKKVTGNIYTDLQNAIAGKLGYDWANRYREYIQDKDEFDWDTILKNALEGMYSGDVDDVEASGKKSKKDIKPTPGEKRRVRMDTSRLSQLTKYITNEILTRFHKAKGNPDQKVLDKLSTDCAHILANIHPDNASQVLMNVYQKVVMNKDKITSGLSAQELADEVSYVMNNIGNKIKEHYKNKHEWFGQVFKKAKESNINDKFTEESEEVYDGSVVTIPVAAKIIRSHLDNKFKLHPKHIATPNYNANELVKYVQDKIQGMEMSDNDRHILTNKITSCKTPREVMWKLCCCDDN